MEVTTVKYLAATCIWLASLLGGLLPFWLKRHARRAEEQRDAAAGEHSHYQPHALSPPPPPHRVQIQAYDEEAPVSSVIGAGYGSVDDGHSHSHGGAHDHSHGGHGHDERVHHEHSHTCCHLDVDRLLSFGNMLGAGIFLGGGLMHLLPEAVSGLASLPGQSWILSEYPLAYLLCGLGFFVILIVEEATVAITTGRMRSPKGEQVLSPSAPKEEPSIPIPPKLSISPPTHVRDLSRNLLQGLTPRVALVPDSVHTHMRTLNCGRDIVEQCSVTLKRAPLCENGPIQQFLDTPDCVRNSPDPFPSLAERGRREHAAQHHHRCPGETVSVSRLVSSFESGNECRSSHATSLVARNSDISRRGEQVPASVSVASLNVSIAPPAIWADPDSDQPPPLLSASGVLFAHSMPPPTESGEERPLLYQTGTTIHEPIYSPRGGHSHGHGDHSHVEITADTSYIVAYLLVLALSFHNIFEGIALGTQERMTTTLSLFVAILAHSPLAGFALGVSLVKSRAAPRMALSCLFLFAVTTPIGTVLGILLSVGLQGSTLTAVSCCFQAFSAGTFFFVAFEEIIPKELALPKDKPIKLALCVVGFLAMAAIKMVDPH